MGLHSLLASRADSVFGIVNGIDTEEWNPEADEYIESRWVEKHKSHDDAIIRTLLGISLIGVGY